MIYVIQELWLDNMENHVESAMGYSNKGYVTDQAVAKKIVEDGGTVDPKTGWALMGQALNRYRVQPLDEFVVR